MASQVWFRFMKYKEKTEDVLSKRSEFIFDSLLFVGGVSEQT